MKSTSLNKKKPPVESGSGRAGGRLLPIVALLYVTGFYSLIYIVEAWLSSTHKPI